MALLSEHEPLTQVVINIYHDKCINGNNYASSALHEEALHVISTARAGGTACLHHCMSSSLHVLSTACTQLCMSSAFHEETLHILSTA